MEIKYIDHLNNFAAASLSAGLGPNEIAVYMRIFWKANKEYWKGFVEISIPELQEQTFIKSINTIMKARKKLIDLRFIAYESPTGRKARYTILPIDTPSKNEGVKPKKMNNTPSKNEGVTPRQQADSRACELPKDYKTIKTNKTLYIDPHENKDFSQVYELYSDNISTGISPVQIEKLAEDIKIYGKSKVMYAILRAAEVNKRTFGYIEGILKNNREGENEGYGKRSSTDGQCGLQEPRDKKWLEQLRHATANQKYPWDNPEEKTNGGN